MTRQPCLCAFLLLTLLFDYCSAFVFMSKQFNVINNKASVNDVYQEVHVDSVSRCSVLCSMDLLCRSFNIIDGSQGLKCELNKDSVPKLLVTSLDTNHYGKFCATYSSIQ